MNLLTSILALTAVLLFSCSQRVLRGSIAYKENGSCIALKKNGSYKKWYVGAFMIQTKDGPPGRYVFSNDTVYFLGNYSNGVYTSKDWAVVDTINMRLMYYSGTDTTPLVYEISEIDYRRLYRSNSHTVR